MLPRRMPTVIAPPAIQTHLGALAAALAARRTSILQAWHSAVVHDRLSESGMYLSRVQFFDHIPEILDAFERRLRVATDAENTAAELENRRIAAEHGVVRWQQSFQLQEVM